jgi:hypothetical protein
MSDKERKRRDICRAVLKEAWRVFKRSSIQLFRSALLLAWKTVRCSIKIHYSKVRGVSFENRQDILRRLSYYKPQDIVLSFQSEANNPLDENAIKIIASIKGKGSAAIGYLSKEISVVVLPELKQNRQAIVMFNEITGLDRESGHLGCNFSYAIL